MHIEAPKIRKAFLQKIDEIFGEKQYSQGDLDRIVYSRDSNFKSAIKIKYNVLEHLPDLIVWPTTPQQIIETIKLCIKFKMPVVPYGAGSGVSGGTIAVKGGVVIDLKKLNKFIKLDEENLLVTVEAGFMGMHLEDELQRKGYTLGHFPSSILCASVGGYLAARSAGQLSSRYGKIEDMVRSFEFVTGRGELIETRDITNKQGMDLNQLLLGTEGAFGFFTKVTLRIFPLGEYRTFRGIRFDNMKTAMEAIRRIMQAGLRPAVVRLYDELDTLMLLTAKSSGHKSWFPQITGFIKDTVKMGSLKAALQMPQTFQTMINSMPIGCLLVLMHEGNERIVLEEQRIVNEISKGLSGEDLGKEPGVHWYENRYSVSYQASKLFLSGNFTDTIEIAASWENIYPLYKKMIKVLGKHCVVMAHLSHVYSDGGSLYFTFAAPLNGLQKSEALYDLIWEKAMRVTLDCGGTISHHHGIGRLKSRYMVDEWGEGVELMRQFKQFYDPHDIMNPGKLLPDIKSNRNVKVA